MIKLAEKIIDEKDVSSLVEWLNSGDRYTKGEQPIAFEQEWSDWLGGKHSVFVNSGSSAILLTLHICLSTAYLSLHFDRFIYFFNCSISCFRLVSIFGESTALSNATATLTLACSSSSGSTSKA